MADNTTTAANQQFADNINNWIARVISGARSANSALKSFKGKLKTVYGIPARIRFTFPRHYVFVEKGVGRGRGINSGKTKPKPAINPAIEQHLAELADIAADGCADIAANRLFIK